MFKIRLTTEQFNEKAYQIYSNLYDLSKVDYKTTDIKVTIGCKIHGYFDITPHRFLGGHGCPKCAREHYSLIRTLTNEEFIEKARKVHGDKYDYSKVEYKGCEIEVCIICPIHGEFYQKPMSHLSGCGCPECAKIKRSISSLSNTEEFIEKALKVHGSKYDYSKVKYVNNRTKVCIICPIHGEFWQTPNSHLNGRGCPVCGREEIISKHYNTREVFIEKAKKVHGDKYDYSKVEYKGNKVKVCIICPTHGEFWMRPNAHLSGQRCYECGKIAISEANKITFDEFLRRANEMHNNKFMYDKSTYNGLNRKMRIICPIHGEFWQTPSMHLRTSGCRKCRTSILERKMLKFLDERNINYIYQCKSDTFPWIGLQSLDFYLPDYNVAIECQGQQHFGLGGWGHNFDFNQIYERDLRKYNLLKEHNIRIYYYCFSEETWKVKLPIYTDDITFLTPEELLLNSGFYSFTT